MKNNKMLLVLLVLSVAGSCYAELWGGGGRVVGFNSYNDFTSPAQMGAYGHRRFRNVPLITAENFDAASDWTAVGGVASDDTDIVITSNNVPISAVRMTGNGSSSDLRATRTTTYNSIENSHIYVRFYIHPGTGNSDPAQISALNLFLSDGTAFTNHMILGMFGQSFESTTGWHEYSASLDNVPMQGGGDRATLYSDFDTIRLTAITPNANQTIKITYDTIAFYPEMIKPKHAITFDDGRSNDYNLAAYMNSKGIRGTFYIIGDLVGTADRLTVEQLTRMQEMGHLIANHGWTNFNWETDNLTDEQLRIEITRMTEWMCANGFTRGARIFALPSGTGALPQGGRDDFYKYYDQIRLTDGLTKGFPGFIQNGWFYTESFDNISQANTSLTTAKNGNTVTITGWHSWNYPAAYSLADWKTYINNVVADQLAGNLDVVTMDELLYQSDDYNRSYAIENSIQLLSKTAIALNTDGSTVLYIVPNGQRCMLSKAVLVVAGTAGTTDISIGQNGALADFIPASDLGNLNSANDSCILQPIPAVNVLLTKSYASGTSIEATITNANGFPTLATLYLFGFLD